MKESRNQKYGLIVGVVAVIVAASVAAGLAYSARQPLLASLKSDNDGLHAAVLSLKDEVSDLGGKLGSYQEIAAHQEGLADSLRRWVLPIPHEFAPRGVIA